MASNIAKQRVREVLTESVREEVGLSPEVFEALETVITETVSAVLKDVLQENQEMMELSFDVLLDRIFDDYTRGLTLAQKDRLRRISDELSLDPSDPFEEYRMKLSDLTDDMFPRKGQTRSNFEDEYFEHTESTRAADPLIRASVAASDHLGSLRNWGAKKGE